MGVCVLTDQAELSDTMMGRFVSAGAGAAAGLMLWLFVDVLEDLFDNMRMYAVLFALMLGYFAVFLALIGPAGVKRALLGAAFLSVPTALLFGLASYRYDSIEQYLDGGYPMLSVLAILVVGTPFVAAFLKDRDAWRHYPELFDVSWTITVRYTAAWLFTGLFWAVLMLSDALLQLVGITIIEDLLDIDVAPYVLSGLILGLGLAVVQEMREYVSPFLILRLLRLLLPVVLVVVALFIAALPFRGLSDLFGSFSAAATLMAMAIGGITLITTALDKTNQNAVSTRGMRLATQGLSLLLPVMGGLSLYAIWLRVDQYGWTPDRLAAATGAAFILIYAVLYALSVMLRGDWMERIRRANVVMALGLVLVAALWLTPVLNAEAISTQSQVKRYELGQVTADKVAVWEMSREWGLAGQNGVSRLQTMKDAPDHAALMARLISAENAASSYAFKRSQSSQTSADKMAELRSLLPVQTKGAPLEDEAFQGISRRQVKEWLSACKLDAGDGQPGCALVLAPFSASGRDPGASRGLAFLMTDEGRVDVVAVSRRSGRLYASGNVQDETTGQKPALTVADLRDIQQGEFRIAPSSRQSLWLGDVELIPDN